ncbi:MAG: hypothetical protein AAGJ81_01470 [Verrucomicrobiota bacterium]
MSKAIQIVMLLSLAAVLIAALMPGNLLTQRRQDTKKQNHATQ